MKAILSLLLCLGSLAHSGTFEIVGSPDITLLTSSGGAGASASTGSLEYELSKSISSFHPNTETHLLAIQGQAKFKVRWRRQGRELPPSGVQNVVCLPEGFARASASYGPYGTSSTSTAIVQTIGFLRNATVGYSTSPLFYGGPIVTEADGSTDWEQRPTFSATTGQQWVQTGSDTWESDITLNLNEAATVSVQGNGFQAAATECTVRITVVSIAGQSVVVVPS